MGQEQVKIMYFAPLPEGLSREEFRTRWRQHWQLGMSLPGWSRFCRYQQFDVITEGEEGLTGAYRAATATSRFAGVGSMWMRSRAILEEHLADTEQLETMLEDEINTFGKAINASVMPVLEHRFIDRGLGAVTVIGRFSRSDGLTHEEYSRRWREVGESIVATENLQRHLSSYVQNHLLTDVEGFGSESDGIVELSFDSPEELKAFFTSPEFADRLSGAEAEFVDFSKAEVLLSHENLLYDDLPALGLSAHAGADG